ncbi:MAG: VIT1/CCC1 transporter family protein [Firmicutes bacterium]|nr:VIT1/CCC1 transporter family protein [Bacillota bacterium]
MFSDVKSFKEIKSRSVKPSAANDQKPDPAFSPYTGHTHRDLRGGALRAAVFGISDGLVSNLSLVIGAAGADPAHGIVRLAGIIGLLGGSFSMAAGEVISMQIQKEGFERELAIEERELHLNPVYEKKELEALYKSRGISPELSKQLADEIMANPKLALDTHAREELGLDSEALGSPIQAGLSSFFSFAIGAFIPLIPFISGNDSTFDVLISIVLTAATALAVGFALGKLTGKGAVFSAVRQLFICAITGAVTYGIGTLLKGSFN